MMIGRLEQKGLTQEELAARSGFGQNYLSDLERGRRNPTVVTLWELANVLGVTPGARSGGLGRGLVVFGQH